MLKRAQLLLWPLFLLLLGSVYACKGSDKPAGESPGSSKPGEPAPLRIAMIPKGTTHEFWKAVHAGALKAQAELGSEGGAEPGARVEVLWKGPLKEDDLKAQIELVQSFTAQHVAGIALAPLNDRALGASVKSAVDDHIPVVVFDSDLKGEAHSSFVATDNFAAGRLAGEAMAKALGGKGNVVLLRYQEGSASTHNREQGFVEALKKYPELKLVSDNQYGGATTESAFAASESLLIAQRASGGQVQGVFAPNESTTFGMLLALQKAGLTGKLQFIGFDASDKLVAALEKGELQGLVLQDPFNMGYLAIKTLVAVLRGQAVTPRIDTGSTLVTRENMAKPEIKQLLHPDSARWLGAAH
jgi:ribose transport system substrate-binding protein